MPHSAGIEDHWHFVMEEKRLVLRRNRNVHHKAVQVLSLRHWLEAGSCWKHRCCNFFCLRHANTSPSSVDVRRDAVVQILMVVSGMLHDVPERKDQPNNNTTSANEPTELNATVQDVVDGTSTHNFKRVSASHFVALRKEMFPPPDKTISAHKFSWMSASRFMTLWKEHWRRNGPATRQHDIGE